MRISNALLSTSVLLVFLFPQAFAAPPGGHLNIEEVAVTVGTPNTTLMINGSDFDFGGPLEVTLAGVPALTVNLTSSTTITATVLTASYPAGDYLLTVSTGNGQSQNDEYDLTIGGVGLPGVDGADGADGAPGLPGADGADGAGTVESVATGSGLTGGPITTTGTISIADAGVTGTHIATGTVTNIDLANTTRFVEVATASGALRFFVTDGNQILRFGAGDGLTVSFDSFTHEVTFSSTGATCDWSGEKWVSHGLEGICAFETGMSVTCSSGLVTNMAWESNPFCPEGP